MKDQVSIEQVIETLHTTYSPLSDACKAELPEHARIFSVSTSDHLVKEGEFADKTYFIVEGCARAYYLKKGKDITDWFAFEGDFISAISSFFLGVPSPHFIEILEPTILLEFSRDSILMFSDKYHDFDRLGRMIVTRTMLQLQQRIVSIQFENAQQKYENLLKIRPDITQRIPLTHIASYLGITLETLSRIRNPKRKV